MFSSLSTDIIYYGKFHLVIEGSWNTNCFPPKRTRPCSSTLHLAPGWTCTWNARQSTSQRRFCDDTPRQIKTSYTRMHYGIIHTHWLSSVPFWESILQPPCHNQDVYQVKLPSMLMLQARRKIPEQCSKPLLVDDYRGLYYPVYWEL